MVLLLPQPSASAPPGSKAPPWHGDVSTNTPQPPGTAPRGLTLLHTCSEGSSADDSAAGNIPGPGRRHTLRGDKRSRAAPTRGPGDIVAGCAEHSPARGPRRAGSAGAKVGKAAKLSRRVHFAMDRELPTPAQTVPVPAELALPAKQKGMRVY